MRWARALRAVEVAEGKFEGSVTRIELEGLYSTALRQSPPQTVAQIGAAYQKLKGFELPTDTAALTWPSNTIAYIDEEYRRLVARQHRCADLPNTPPRSPQSESIEFIESPEQNLAKKGGATDGPSEEGSGGD